MNIPCGYALLDFGGGRRLEQWGDVRLVRPDRHAAADPVLPANEWAAAHARFEGRLGSGRWVINRGVPDHWLVEFAGLRFEIKLAPSMHTGLFPEQRPQWQWMLDRAASIGRPISVLNLFAYTGGASLALAAAGHRVTHVDASTPAIAWARRNAGLNGLDTIRWLHDDVRAFVDRELRRERQYDGVVLDPPAFGRGSGGPWLLDRDLPDLLRGVNLLLSQARAFVLVNAYGGGVDASRLKTLCETALGVGARRGMEAGTLSLSDARRRLLPTSVFARV